MCTHHFFLDSDLPQDLCPLYRPGEWEDLASEKDINPFSKFKSLNKEKRQQIGEKTTTSGPQSTRPLETQPPHTHIRARTRAHTRALVYYFIFSHLKKKKEKNLISKKEGECVYRGSMCAFGPSPYFCLPG